MEYIITTDDKYLTLSKREVQWTRTHSFASVFTNRQRAQALADKHGGEVIPHYGFVVQRSKSTVLPRQSDRNKRQPYRSI